MEAMKTLDDYPDLMTVAELAEYLRCSLKTAYNLIHSGELVSVKVNAQHYRVKKSSLTEWLKR